MRLFSFALPLLFVAPLARGALEAQATGAPAASATPTPTAATASVLPPAPTAPIASGDSVARVARARLYFARGNAALAAGMRDTARVAWENALYEDVTLTDAAVALATMLTEDGQGFYAQRILQRALHYDPQNPKLLHFSAHKKTPDASAP
jgi:Tfp pilus assembly protein PilF